MPDPVVHYPKPRVPRGWSRRYDINRDEFFQAPKELIEQQDRRRREINHA